MKIVTTKGLLVGVIVWVMYEVLIISNSSCAKLSNCGGGQMLVSNLIAIGGLGPAWLAGSLFDELFSKNN
jgi:hypothetical protein